MYTCHAPISTYLHIYNDYTFKEKPLLDMEICNSKSKIIKLKFSKIIL